MFPLFCFNDADAELWEDDPAELIRKESDLLEDFWDPRLTGMNVLLDLMQLRSADYLHLVVTHCIGVLNAYQACPENPRPEHLARQKDGALVVIGNLIGRFEKVFSQSYCYSYYYYYFTPTNHARKLTRSIEPKRTT